MPSTREELQAVAAAVLRRGMAEQGDQGRQASLDDHQEWKQRLLETQRPALVALLRLDSVTVEVRRAVAKLLNGAPGLRNEADALLGVLASQTSHPDDELVRSLARCLAPLVKDAFPPDLVLEWVDRLLDQPRLTVDTRLALMDLLAEVAGTRDAERLLLRKYSSPLERGKVAEVFARISERRLDIRRLSSAGFESLVGRTLEARERAAGRDVRYRVTGGAWDGGVDVRAQHGALGDGGLAGIVQCKNTSRLKTGALGTFAEQAAREIAEHPSLWQEPPDRVQKIFVTTATGKTVEDARPHATDSKIELIDGHDFLTLVRAHVLKDATLGGD